MECTIKIDPRELIDNSKELGYSSNVLLVIENATEAEISLLQHHYKSYDKRTLNLIVTTRELYENLSEKVKDILLKEKIEEESNSEQDITGE